MKKKLYLIPLFIFIFLISSSKVFAADYTFVDSPITVEQKSEYLSFVFNSDFFKEALITHPYYVIAYNEKQHYPFYTNPGYPFNKNIIILMYSQMPTFTTFSTEIRIYELNRDKEKKMFGYSAIDYTVNINSVDTISRFRFTNTSDEILIDYILSTNFEYIHTEDINIYDSDNNLLNTIYKGENVFSNLNIRPEIPEEKIEPVIDSILNTDDKLYSLSKQLIGELPEEFTFLYSICQLFLGLVIVLVILSPIIILLRLFR